jgi:hypothetical protein
VRILIADAAYDPAWTRVRGSIAVQGLPIAPTSSVQGPSASPLIQTGAVSSAAAAASLYTRFTFSTPIALTPVTAASVSPAPGQTMVASAQPKRKMLTIQNNAQATPTDTAPTMYIGFGQQAVPGYCLALAPNAGISWEVNPPQEDIWVSWGTYSNSAGSTIITGVILQAIGSALAPPTVQ